MATCCIHCGVEEGELHLSNCPELRSAFERIERERDEAREECERLREHHKVAVDWWMQEAQSVKPLTKEVERLREERDYYRRDNEKLHNALAWEHNESENAMDARRYRWLRHHYTAAVKFAHPKVIVIDDAAIDAARGSDE